MYKVKNNKVKYKNFEFFRGKLLPDIPKDKQQEIKAAHDKLPEIIGSGRPHKAKVRAVMKVIDLYSTAKFEEISVCQNGCSHCCAIPVEITSAEAQYIADGVGLKMPSNINSERYTGKDYCPFHDEKTASCGIYEYRPMACRMFYAFDDPKYCKSGESHAVSIDGKHLSECVDKPILNVMHNVLEWSNNQYGDIRAFFGSH